VDDYKIICLNKFLDGSVSYGVAVIDENGDDDCTIEIIQTHEILSDLLTA